MHRLSLACSLPVSGACGRRGSVGRRREARYSDLSEFAKEHRLGPSGCSRGIAKSLGVKQGPCGTVGLRNRDPEALVVAFRRQRTGPFHQAGPETQAPIPDPHDEIANPILPLDGFEAQAAHRSAAPLGEKDAPCRQRGGGGLVRADGAILDPATFTRDAYQNIGLEGMESPQNPPVGGAALKSQQGPDCGGSQSAKNPVQATGHPAEPNCGPSDRDHLTQDPICIKWRIAGSDRIALRYEPEPFRLALDIHQTVAEEAIPLLDQDEITCLE